MLGCGAPIGYPCNIHRGAPNTLALLTALRSLLLGSFAYHACARERCISTIYFWLAGCLSRVDFLRAPAKLELKGVLWKGRRRLEAARQPPLGWLESGEQFCCADQGKGPILRLSKSSYLLVHRAQAHSMAYHYACVLLYYMFGEACKLWSFVPSLFCGAMDSAAIGKHL